MAFKFEPAEPLDAGVRRIAAEQIAKALAEIDTGQDRDAVVHSVRKRCKKLRALVRLVRVGLGDAHVDANRELRDFARSLAEFRDGRVMLATHDGLVGHFGDVLDGRALAGVRARLARAQPRSDTGDAGRLEARLAEVRAGLEALGKRAATWSLAGEATTVLEHGYRRTYKRGRDAFRGAADGSAEDFHEWRKRAKYHWHHMQLVAPLASTSLKPRIRSAERLSDLLGDAHDLAVYEDRLDAIAAEGDATAIETLRALAVWRRGHLERRAVELGETLYAPKPRALAALVEASPASLRETG